LLFSALFSQTQTMCYDSRRSLSSNLRRSMASQLSSLPELHLDLVLCKSYDAFQIMQVVIPSAEVRGGLKLALKSVASIAFPGTAQPYSFDEKVNG